MGMSRPVMGESPHDLTPGSLRRNTSSRAASPAESLSGETSEGEAGTRHGMAADDLGRASTILVRKRLPWLDTATTRPGFGVVKPHKASKHQPKHPEIPPVLADRKRPAHNDTATTKPPIRPKQIESAYVSSDYSAATPSDTDTLPITLPKKDPASYEKLVDAVFEPGGRTPTLHPGAKRAAKTELDAPRKGSKHAEVVDGDMADGTKTLESSPRAYRDTPKKNVDNTGPRRCKSCDTEEVPGQVSSPRTLRHQKQGIATTDNRASPRKATTLNKPSSQPDQLPANSSSSSRTHPHSPGQRQQSNTDLTDPSKSPGSLNRAVTGLENLMEEALNIARDAVKTGRSEAVAGVLNNATMALRQANSVQSNMHKRRSASAHDSQCVSDSDSGSGSSCQPSHKVSAETLPTVYTKSTKSKQQSIGNDRASKAGMRSGKTERDARKDRNAYSDDNSISHTPPRLYQPASAESIVRDFAYNGLEPLPTSSPRNIYGAAASFYGDQGESVALQPGVRQSIPGYDKLLPALPAQAYLPAQPTVVHHPALSTHAKHGPVHRAHQSRRANQDQIVLAAQESEVEPLVQRPLQRKGTGPLPALPNELRQKLDQRQEGRAPTDYGSHHTRPSSFLRSAYYRNDEKTNLSREVQLEQSPDSEEPIGKPTRYSRCRNR